MTCPRCGSAIPPSSVECGSCGFVVLPGRPLSSGFLLGSRYEIVRPLGAGGMGRVYLARDRVLEEDVAIKVLRSEIAADADMARRFRQEIRLARRVRHRNVCGIHEYGEADGLRFIAMEYVEGVDLRRLLRDGGALPADDAFAVSTQVAKGLQAIHDAGIIHRDLKSSNIMRDAGGTVRLMDFGIAKQHGADVTLAGAGRLIVGTPEYMSPEQARAEPLDFRTDIYSLGVVIYEIFTGTVPFRGDTPVATLLKQLTEPPRLSGPGAPALPEALVPVLARTLAKDPEQRFPDARALLAAVREARQGPVTPPPRPPIAAADAVPAPTLVSASRAASPRRLRLAVLGASLAAALALAAGALWLAARPPAASTASAPPPPSETASPPPPAARATLVVDALPWGEVERIVDDAGREWPTGADRYTPYVVDLPPGDYSVTVSQPRSSRRETLRVHLTASQAEKRVVAFQRVDANEYLAKAGF